MGGSLLRYQKTSDPAPSAVSEATAELGGTATGQRGDTGPANTSLRMARCGVAEHLGYVPPELHEGKSYWYIDYYARDPADGRLKRKRLKCNRVQGVTARRVWARNAIAELTRKLQQGWTPFAPGEARDQFTTLGAALDLWDRTKTRQLKHSSPYSYTSMTALFREWARSRDLLDKAAYAFNSAHAVEYLHYISEVRLVGNRTYNNHLTYVRMLFSWMREKQFTTADPWLNMKRRKQPKKSRTYLTRTELQEMLTWIERNDPNFLFPVLWIYYGLVRPGELRRLKLHHLRLHDQVMHVPAEQSKSGDERHATVPDAMRAYLEAAGVQHMPGKCWLVGADLLPGDKSIARNKLNRHWVRLRTALGWDHTKQLYSLRDTGIIDYLRAGVDPLAVMQQAGHKDLHTTNAYVRHAFPHGPAEIRAKAVPLRAALSSVSDSASPSAPVAAPATALAGAVE